MTRLRPLGQLLRDSAGTMVIETAIVTPALVLLSLGAFEVSAMISRQNELQQAASEAAQIALAAKPDTAAKRTTVKDIIMASTGLSTGQVTLSNEFRCGNTSTRVAASTSCAAGTVVTTYLKIEITDTFTPVWTDFGVGAPFDYEVTRMVIVA